MYLQQRGEALDSEWKGTLHSSRQNSKVAYKYFELRPSLEGEFGQEGERGVKRESDKIYYLMLAPVPVLAGNNKRGRR